ncbi:MAG: hypothetical protein IKZ82_00175 [Clostridia bacterium]|nr:hypothetical protein [Clostridia bacterium]
MIISIIGNSVGVICLGMGCLATADDLYVTAQYLLAAHIGLICSSIAGTIRIILKKRAAKQDQQQ